jgi:hypothetical protein
MKISLGKVDRTLEEIPYLSLWGFDTVLPRVGNLSFSGYKTTSYGGGWYAYIRELEFQGEKYHILIMDMRKDRILVVSDATFRALALPYAEKIFTSYSSSESVTYRFFETDDILIKPDITVYKNVIDVANKNCQYLFHDNYRICMEGDSLQLYIKFDLVKISNCDGYVKTLRDLVVRMTFIYEDSRVVLTGIGAARLTVTKAETKDGGVYIHPHIGYMTNESYHPFCLGDSALGRMYGKLREKVDEFVLECFLYSLGEYVAYESLEGGPYYRNIEAICTYKRIAGTDWTADKSILARKVADELFKKYPMSELASITVEPNSFSPSVRVRDSRLSKDILEYAYKRFEEKFPSDSSSYYSELWNATMKKRSFGARGSLNPVKYGEELIPVRIIPVPKEDYEEDEKYLQITETSSIKGDPNIDSNLRSELRVRVDKEISDIITYNTDEYIELFKHEKCSAIESQT